jgi:hypothetical protein
VFSGSQVLSGGLRWIVFKMAQSDGTLQLTLSERENPVGVVDGFMDNWTEDQRRLFNEDWANDDGLCELEQLPEPLENQIGTGSKRKHANDDVPSKRQRPEEYFTIKSAKQVNVRKFRTTGTHSTVFIFLSVYF